MRVCVREREREGGREIDILQSSTLFQPESARPCVRACVRAAPCLCVSPVQHHSRSGTSCFTSPTGRTQRWARRDGSAGSDTDALGGHDGCERPGDAALDRNRLPLAAAAG